MCTCIYVYSLRIYVCDLSCCILCVHTIRPWLFYVFFKVISPLIDKVYIYGCISYHHTPHSIVKNVSVCRVLTFYVHSLSLSLSSLSSLALSVFLSLSLSLSPSFFDFCPVALSLSLSLCRTLSLSLYLSLSLSAKMAAKIDFCRE